jgi:hypothetical protein
VADALWAGTPALALRGAAPSITPGAASADGSAASRAAAGAAEVGGAAGRAGASSLCAANLCELAVADAWAYEEVAVALAVDDAKYMAIRGKLEASRDDLPLFDTARLVLPPQICRSALREGGRFAVLSGPSSFFCIFVSLRVLPSSCPSLVSLLAVGNLACCMTTCLHPLCRRWVRNLEAGLWLAWQRHEQGLPPDHIDVPDAAAAQQGVKPAPLLPSAAAAVGAE